MANEYFTASIFGTVEDNSEIALITVDGHEVSLTNGEFSKDLFVKQGGKDIEIVSFDVHGNKSSKKVKIERQNISVVSNTFDFLDPRKITWSIRFNSLVNCFNLNLNVPSPINKSLILTLLSFKIFTAFIKDS